jgi:hypothetical protein
MKPTTQISHNGNSRFPLTDYNYQPKEDGQNVAGRSIAKLTGFHKLSSDFIGTEMVRDFAMEFSAFTVIAALSAWPIVLSIIAVARLLWS